MTFDEMYRAIHDAENTIRRGDEAIARLAKLLAGRLRVADIPTNVLADLKRELKAYNIRTERWKAQ